MYERFSDRARHVMRLANMEAQKLNDGYIGTEHVLLGLIKEGQGIAMHIFHSLQVDPACVEVEVRKLLCPGPTMIKMDKLPQTPRTKRVIDLSIAEAKAFGQNYIGTEHLLLGLLGEPDGVAGQVLRGLGINLENARQQCLNIMGTSHTVSIQPSGAVSGVPGNQTEPSAPPDQGPRVKINQITFTWELAWSPEALVEGVRLVKEIRALATEQQPGMTSADRLARIAALTTELGQLMRE